MTDERQSKSNPKADVGMLIFDEPLQHTDPVFMADLAQREGKIPADKSLNVLSELLENRDDRSALS